MENLIPREVYDVDETGYRERLGIISGILFGFIMAIFFLLTTSRGGFGWRVFLSLCLGTLCGVGFGRAFPKRFRKRMSSMVDRLYEGNPVTDIAPSLEEELRYRLPCSWKRSKNFSVGGVLYVGPMGLLFVPHKINLPRDSSAFEMGPNKSLSLRLSPQEVNGLLMLLVPRPSPALEVIWPEGTPQFLVPAPNQVLKLLDERLREVAYVR
jgi:hypothetical protein